MARNGRNVRTVAAALALGTMLGACSADIYYDRRESLTFQGGDAVATNKVTQIIDPWPPAAANRRIEADGQRMQRAIERYRTNRTTPLQTTSTSSVPYNQTPAGAGTPAAGP
jgi:hypothetical protein